MERKKSIGECAATYKFAQKRSWRQPFLGNGTDIREEFYKTYRLGMLFKALVHTHKQLKGLGFERGKLKSKAELNIASAVS